MFASGISSSAQQNIASFQSQQQQKVQQQFQSLAAQFQSGGLTTAQSGNVLSQENSPTAATSGGNSSQSLSQNGPAHWNHRLPISVGPGAGVGPTQAVDRFGSASPSSAQQAYNASGNIPQLSSEFASAELGTQASSLSLTA